LLPNIFTTVKDKKNPEGFKIILTNRRYMTLITTLRNPEA